MISELLYAILVAYGALFPVVNPLGGSLLYNSITHSLDASVKRRLARKIAMNAFFLLIGVLFVGVWVLKLFGIQIPIVQLAGGAVVATRGWMIMNTGVNARAGDSNMINNEKTAMSSSFFPLTLPMTAGPGSIATAITLGAEAQIMDGKLMRIADYIGFSVGILLIAITVYLTYHSAGYLMKRLRENSRMVIMKLSAFITLCIGLTVVSKGLLGLIQFYVGAIAH